MSSDKNSTSFQNEAAPLDQHVVQNESSAQDAHPIKTFKQRSLGAIFGVILSRTSGVFRTLIVNASFGLGMALDAFNAAFRLPNGLRDLFADGAFSAAFIKVYADARIAGPDEEKKLLSLTSGFFLSLTFLLAILFCFFSDTIMSAIMGADFKRTDGFHLASLLFKMLAFYLPFTMLNALAMAVLGVHGKTFRAMNASIFLNVGMVVGALLFAPFCIGFGIEPIFGLAIGSLLGVIIQMIYQFKPLYSLGLLSWPSFRWSLWKHYKPLREILLLMTPRAIGQGALTLALLINTYFATSLGFGVLSSIVTAVTIIQVPIGLFGVATGFSAQPLLANALHLKDTKQFSLLLTQGIEKSLLLACFAVLGFSLLIVPFYHFIFEYGKVTYSDTIQNSLAVCAYSIGILFSVGSKVVISAFYALNRTRYLVYNAVAYLCTNATLSFLLAPKLGILGLGLSYGTSSAIDFFLNLFFFHRIYQNRHGQNPYQQTSSFALKIMIFSIFAYAIPLLGVFLVNNYWKNFVF